MKTLIALTALFSATAMPAIAENHEIAEIDTIFAHHGGEHLVDIVATAQDAGSFTTLLAAAEAAGLVEALRGEGPLTVFAPTDEAFAALGSDTIEMLLMPENKNQLVAILSYHVIPGEVEAAVLAGVTTEAETLNGTVEIDGTDGVMVNDATVIQADVEASNGVIHVIDKVLLP
ncbi:fasciclin domain-containing protein [Ponticaulis sp.]|uniref:fasciclin domain-containing protein n=1 Tax=Ponticaulis sp. TaxID=2020902 RepID=UPI0025D6DDE8|nr:fasciclin domain-containing protein [Ponticaulis sp.]|tara:strand:- start:43897 stop:44418 length:522 start_codon:yes stop_codon:yes gene_type:complete